MWVVIRSLILFTNLYKMEGATIYLPYKGTEMVNFSKFIQCEESQPNIEKSVEECDKKFRSQDEICIGYLVKNGNYKLCKILSSAEIDSGLGTNFTNDDKIYLFKNNLQSNIYISMDGLNFSTTVYDNDNLIGTSNLIESDLIPGKVGNGIKMEENRRGFVLQTKEAECFCSFAYCNGKISISLWIISHGKNDRHVLIKSRHYYDYFLQLNSDDQIGFWFRDDGVNLYGTSTSTVSRSDWTFVMITFDVNIGATIYFNGIQDSFFDISTAGVHGTGDSACEDVIFFGWTTSFGDSPNASIDEIMYFYDAVSAEEVFWMYMIYEGLEPIEEPEIINNNDLYDNEYLKITDGNEETCVNVKSVESHGVFSLNMLISSFDLKVNVTGKGNCNANNILLYGNKEITYNFTGLFEKLLLMNSSMTDNNFCEYSYSYNKGSLNDVVLTIFNEGNTELEICEFSFV